MKKIEQEKTDIKKKIGKKTGEDHRESNLFRPMEDHMTLSNWHYGCRIERKSDNIGQKLNVRAYM